MSILYDRIVELCESRGISGYKLCKDTNMTPSIITDLKMGRKEGLSAKNADKIATYFGVSVGYLLGTEEEKKPLVNDDEELQEYLEILRTRPECRILFSLTKDASKEDVEKAVAIIEALRKTEGRE